jgi:hypothetical protein
VFANFLDHSGMAITSFVPVGRMLFSGSPKIRLVLDITGFALSILECFAGSQAPVRQSLIQRIQRPNGYRPI